ncbi:MAG: TlpA family protein disulfide reductase [Burkholderiales bacterium]|nr:TlpA family protein disulfide reductase [Burkholderiales bacterium]
MSALGKIALGLALWTALAAANAAGLRAFDAHSFEAIKASRAGRPFVLAFWSVYCEPCRKEMPLWERMVGEHPQIDVILVATDAPGERDLVLKFLQGNPPGAAELWAFADDYADPLRYAVDRSWRGELPRTYFFDAAHRYEARSGLPDKAWVENWFRRHAGGKGTR